MHTNCPNCQKLNNPSVRVCACGSELGSPLDQQPNQQSERQSVSASAPQFYQKTAPVKSPNFPEQQLPPAAGLELGARQQQAIRRLLASETADPRKPSNRAIKTKLKKLLAVASFLLTIGAVLAVWGGVVDLAGISAEEREKERATTLAESNPALDARNGLANNPDAKYIIEGKVTDVLSGDTIQILDKDNQEYQIKLEGIDAPELEQDFGKEAKINLFALVFGKKVQIVRRMTGADGAVVGKVLLNGASVSLEQLMMGLAWHDKTIALEPTENDRYAYNETVARRDGFGLWAEKNPLPPWEYRNTANQNVKQTTSVEPNNETPAASTTAAPKANTVVQETTTQVENRTTIAETAPAQLKTLPPPDTSQPPQPKVSMPVLDGYERKTTLISRTATARCGDGTLSFSATRSGSCARHGGVAEWLGGSTAAPPAAKGYTRPRNYNLGPRGGCYFINDYGKKVYVDRELCAK